MRGMGERAGHVVLPSVEAAAYASLSRRPSSRQDRYALGRALRRTVPRSSLGVWRPADDRVGPVDQVIAAHEGRLGWLIPVRVGRMIASPYGFLRGTAIVMADDVARLPSTGITPVICGDAHLGNFGFYASPERDLVIDLNDFDEAHPGGWEWDLRRLVASIWVAGRQNGATEDDVRRTPSVPASRPTGDEVAPARRAAAAGAVLPAARRRPAAGDRVRQGASRGGPARPRRQARTPHQRPRAAPVHPRAAGRRRRIVEEPPLITRVSDRRTRILLAAPRRVPAHAGPALAPRARAATRSSTSRTRSSASAASGCGPTSRCWRAAARTTWCSCSSSRPGGRCWRGTCTASRPGTRTRASGWSSTSRRCRRSATRCWAGPTRTAGSTTSGSSGT